MNSLSARSKLMLLAVCVLILPACGGVFNTKMNVPTTYVLAPATISVEQKLNSTIDLAVSLPVAAPGLDTERIAALHEHRRLDYFLDAQWGATATKVVQSLLCETFAQGEFHSVAPEQARLNATHLVDLQLLDFQAEYSDEHAPPTIHVSLTATLMRMKDRKLLASFPISAQVKADQNTLSAVVAAYESASQKVALDLSAKVLAAANE
jgi:cholesterol transport system auxiliary component